MRLFRVNSDDKFTEYQEQDFKGRHREHVLEAWLASNPQAILEDGSLLLIGRQVTTNLGSSIDLLALDQAGSVVVLELKRDRTPRETLAQALEYASFAAGLDSAQLEQILRDYTGDEGLSLAEYHRHSFRLAEDTAVSFNKEQRIVIVGQEITPAIRQTAGYLRGLGLRVTCVEFSYFQTESGERLLSADIVVGKEAGRGTGVTSKPGRRTNKKLFLEGCDEAGRPVFEAILALSEKHRLPIHWGVVGFSLNVDFGDRQHVGICDCYPAAAGFGQTLYTTFSRIGPRIAGSEEIIAAFREKAERTGLFVPAGGEIKCVIESPLTKEQLQQLADFFLDLAKQMEQHGLRPPDESTGTGT